MEAFFAAIIGKSVYEKWKVNEPGVFYFLFYFKSRDIPKKPVAGVARKQSKHEICYLEYISFLKSLFLFRHKCVLQKCKNA